MNAETRRWLLALGSQGAAAGASFAGAVAAWSWLFALVILLAPVWIATLAYLALTSDGKAA